MVDGYLEGEVKMRNNEFHRKMAFAFRHVLRTIHRLFAFINFRRLDRWLLPHASCVYIVNKDGKVLAVSRPDDQTKFGLPGGKVEPGESDLWAAKREFKEETGINLSWLSLVKTYEATDDFEYWTTCYMYYPAYDNPSDWVLNPRPSETGLVKWIDRSELLQGPFANFNRKLFARIDSKINVRRDDIYGS